jgi:hypothetical protein
VVGVHVDQAGAGVGAAGEELVEEHRLVVDLVTVEAHGHEPRGDRHGDAVVDPAVGPVAVVPVGEREMAPVASNLALGPLDPRAPRLVPGRQVPLPEVGRLDDVVVDGDQPGQRHAGIQAESDR